MKKLCAILAGIFLALIIFLGFDKFMDIKIKENKEAVRNHRSYQRYWSSEAQKLVMDDKTLPILGSSELVSLEDYNKNISSFLNGDSMNVMPIGAGNFQSLSHTMGLGAIADGIPSKKVALFLSPQWFSPKGITPESFPSRFGEDTLLAFLQNDKISPANKEYVLNRTLNLLSGSPTQYQRVLKYERAFKNSSLVDLIYTKVMSSFWNIRQKYEVYKQLDSMVKDLPKVDVDKINFSDMLKLAEEQGKAASTNNDFGIYDEYWNTYIKKIYDAGEIKEKKQVFTESPEYDDLKCFLNVAKELGIEVILVSIPVKEKWYTYQGELCDVYYQNIRNIAKEYENVTFVDMSKYDKEKYFLHDIMHLGWKGWTRINEALYTEFKK